MGEHFYRYCQMIFLAWLTLFGLLVAFSLRSVNYSVALPEQKPEPLPTVVEAVPQPAPPPPPPPVEPPVEKKPEYLVLARGNAAGNGSLGVPVTSGDKKQIEIRVPYTGNLGEYRTFRYQERNARSFDLMGKWKVKDIKKHVDLQNVPIRLLQLYEHDRYARLSVVYEGKGTDYLPEVRYTPEELIFCLTEPGASDSRQAGQEAAGLGAGKQASDKPARTRADKAAETGAESGEKSGKISGEGKKPEKKARKKRNRPADKPADNNGEAAGMAASTADKAPGKGTGMTGAEKTQTGQTQTEQGQAKPNQPGPEQAGGTGKMVEKKP